MPGTKVKAPQQAGNSIVRTLRLPSDLNNRLREEAEGSGRSVHAEMLRRLSMSFGEEFAIEQDGSGTLKQIAIDIRALREIAEKFAP